MRAPRAMRYPAMSAALNQIASISGEWPVVVVCRSIQAPCSTNCCAQPRWPPWQALWSAVAPARPSSALMRAPAEISRATIASLPAPAANISGVSVLSASRTFVSAPWSSRRATVSAAPARTASSRAFALAAGIVSSQVPIGADQRRRIPEHPPLDDPAVPYPQPGGDVEVVFIAVCQALRVLVHNRQRPFAIDHQVAEHLGRQHFRMCAPDLEALQHGWQATIGAEPGREVADARCRCDVVPGNVMIDELQCFVERALLQVAEPGFRYAAGYRGVDCLGRSQRGCSAGPGELCLHVLEEPRVIAQCPDDLELEILTHGQPAHGIAVEILERFGLDDGDDAML